MRKQLIIKSLVASCAFLFCLAGTILGRFAVQADETVTNKATIMFWNLENFFDFVDGGTGESDAEFSATGPRKWTKKRFYRKCNAVAKTILWAGSGAAGLPDIVGMAEVENRFVLRQMVTKTALRKLDYEIVHFDSPDPRGIDCALLYRASRLTLVSAQPCRVSAPELQTRDILLAQFLTPDGDSLAVLVNHHPSKYGGGETDWRREVAVARLRALGDSLAAVGWTRAVAVGDFNDVPDNPLFKELEPAFSLCRRADGRGSIRFNGEWQLIDLCFVSPALAGTASFSVLEPPFLTERDAAHSGEKPLRTYSGPRYLGGVSDHRPILVRITLPPFSPKSSMLPSPRSSTLPPPQPPPMLSSPRSSVSPSPQPHPIPFSLQSFSPLRQELSLLSFRQSSSISLRDLSRDSPLFHLSLSFVPVSRTAFLPVSRHYVRDRPKSLASICTDILLRQRISCTDTLRTSRKHEGDRLSVQKNIV